MTAGASVLILGGVGFIGRNFVVHLVDNYLKENGPLSFIRVVDKVLPATAYLTKSQSSAFERVEFKQANLANAAAVEKAFARDDGSQFDYVVNLAAETRYGQSEGVYEEKILQLSVNCAKEAAKRKVKLFIEFSTAQIYEAGKKASTEEDKLKPWTNVAKFKQKAEEQLRAIPDLPWVIVRPAIVYGPSDVYGITPRLIIGALYQELKEEMKLLWTKDLRINTVHVTDVVRAIWHILDKKPVHKIYNLADSGDTNQETVNAAIRELFGIETGFQGTIISNFAKLNLASVTEDVNEKHLQPWSDLCKRANIQSTPLTPYLDQELLYNNALSVDGSLITTELGFKYDVPELTADLLRQVIDGYVESGLFPKGLLRQ